MGVIKRGTRFKIFARDQFTCRYCGRKAPDVTLEVDHLLPKSRGGRHRLANLVTACFDCNRGKRARLLPRPTSQPDGIPALAWFCCDCCPHDCDVMRKRPRVTRPIRIEQLAEASWYFWYRGECGHEWRTGWGYTADGICAMAQQTLDERIEMWPPVEWSQVQEVS